MIELARLLSKLAMRLVLCCFWFFPIKQNKIVLLNGCNFKYADSPRCVAEYLKNFYSNKVQVYFAVKNSVNYREEGICFVEANTWKYYYHICTAKVFLTNDGGISYIPFRKKQFVINTWHGGGAYKPIGTSLNDNYFFKMDLKLTSSNTDIFLSSCHKFTQVVSKALMIPEDKFYEIGLPRNDSLVHLNLDKISEIRNKLGLKPEQKVVLYAPTFRRKNVSVGQNLDFEVDICTQELLKALNDRWSAQWVMGFRAHPGIADKRDRTEENVIDLSRYPDMQELLMLADVLITDYSSCCWDFMLTQKPIFIFAPDLKEYSERCKLYTPISEWPFPIAETPQELCKKVREFDSELYQADCQQHYRLLGGKETGIATQLIGDKIVEIMNLGKRM